MMNKIERLQYIKDAAARIKSEKKLAAEVAATETAYINEFKAETDFSAMDEFSGRVATGLVKIRGGFRHLPVFIL